MRFLLSPPPRSALIMLLALAGAFAASAATNDPTYSRIFLVACVVLVVMHRFVRARIRTVAGVCVAFAAFVLLCTSWSSGQMREQRTSGALPSPSEATRPIHCRSAVGVVFGSRGNLPDGIEDPTAESTCSGVAQSRFIEAVLLMLLGQGLVSRHLARGCDGVSPAQGAPVSAAIS